MYTVKGAELQETTVCHAEENEHINTVVETVFDQRKSSVEFAFALSAVK